MEPPNLSPYEKKLIAKGAKEAACETACDLPEITFGSAYLLSRDMAACLVLGLYLVLNCSVTVSNKLILHTPCPFLLTASHATATFIACRFICRGKPKIDLRRNEHIKLLCFSSLYTINIAISNAGLGVVTLPVHQAIRATSPVLTLLLAKVLPVSTASNYGPKTYFTLLPITAGVILATCGGQYGAAPWGLFLTMIGAILAVAKTITTNILLQKDRLNLRPVELLCLLSPYAGFQAVLWAILSGEVGVFLDTATDSKWLAMMLLINAGMAAALNVASFEANKQSGPLAMAITANLKQVILLAVPVNSESPSSLVVAGTILTIGGSVWHAHARHQDEQNPEFTSSTIPPKHLGDHK